MTVIIDIDLETDLSEFTSTVTDGGDLSWAAAAGLGGSSGGLSLLLDDTNNIYGIYALGANNTSGRLRARFYVDPNSITMGAGDYTNIFYTFSAGDYNDLVVVTLLKSATSYQIRCTVSNDAGSAATSAYDITDAPHYIEFDYLRATGASTNDGNFVLYIDGSTKETIATIDNYTVFPYFRAVLMGIKYPSAGISGTFYLDELVVNDDGGEIGPVKASTPMTLTGAVSMAGALSYLKAKAVTFTGAVASAGALSYVKSIVRTFTGGITPTGPAAYTLGVASTFTGAVAQAGVLTKRLPRSFAGSVAMAGVFTRGADVIRTFAGSVAMNGVILKQLARTLAGGLTPSGVLAYLKAIAVTFAGTVTSSGTLAKVYNGGRTFAGAITPTGTLTKAASFVRSYAGSVASSGAVTRVLNLVRTFAGAVASVGAYSGNKVTAGVNYMTLTGSVAMAGAVSWSLNLVRTFTGAVATSGTLIRSLLRSFAGAITPTGLLSGGVGVPVFIINNVILRPFTDKRIRVDFRDKRITKE